MLGLWKELKGKRDWRAGHKYADEIIRDWSSGTWSDPEIHERLQLGPLARETYYLSMFNAGYSVRWQECGEDDAARGSVRARKFKSHWYNMGWWNEMVRRHERGWRHERLDREFERMRTSYWDKIASGDSDAYYEE